MIKSLNDLTEILDALGIPHAYMTHLSEPGLPHISYQINTETFGADDCVYLEREYYIIQFISAKREFALERRFKDLLNTAKHHWQFDFTTYDQAEKTYITQYTI